jgi:hypothetical protein
VFVPARVRAVRQNPGMAQKTVVLLSDDLDGGPADESVTFGLDGVSYEIDLSAANAARLRQVFAVYIAAARRTGGRSTLHRRTGGSPARADREQLAAIRAWARARGMDVNDRGRIPRQIVEAYHAGPAAPAEEPAAAQAASPRGRRPG